MYSSKHDHADSTTLPLIRTILGVYTARYHRGAVVEEVIVQLPVAAAELERLEEEGVVEEGQGVEDIEFELWLVRKLHDY